MPVTTMFKAPTNQRRPDMAMIYVRTKPGRKAFYEGRIIPQDQFIPVTHDPYIRRLVDHWGDLEVQEGGATGKPAAAAASKPGRHVPPGNPQNVSRHPAPNAPNTPPASAKGTPGTGAPRPEAKDA